MKSTSLSFKSFFLTLTLGVAATFSAFSALAATPPASYPALDSCLTRPLPTVLGWTSSSAFVLQDGEEGRRLHQVKSAASAPFQAKFVAQASPLARLERRATLAEIEEYGLEKEGPIQNPTWSPDSTALAYTRGNDLFVYWPKPGREVRLTSDGSDLIKNGYASWVYYEEILGRPSQYRAFWWSPDSKRLAFFHSNDSQVPVFPIYLAPGRHGSLEKYTYPKAGDPNPQVKVGVATADGSRPVVWTALDPARDQYFGQPYWTPDGSALWLQWMNRDQNLFMIYAADPANGSVRPIYSEEQASWIDWIENPVFVPEGLLMVRDFTGWEQVYLCPFNGAQAVCLTTGENRNMQILRADPATRKLYYTARARVSTAADLYEAPLPAYAQARKAVRPAAPKRLTTGTFHHEQIRLSPDGRHFLSVYGNASTPRRLGLFASGKGLVRDLAGSAGEALASARLPRTELVQIQTPDGFTLPALITWPLDLDKSKKYPVLVNIYGGPYHGTVVDRFSLTPSKLYWAQQGVIQITMDHRGSGHCGKVGMAYMHRSFGKWELNDYKLWIDYLRQFPFVDADRVGITGYSYGGYMAALAVCTAGDYFPYGIAGAGVYDWELYDSHYTERYMDRPEDNAEGYKAASVVANAGNYANFGKPSLLLVTHGTADDNVHFQHAMQLVEALMATGKPFEFMLYPQQRHGYRGLQRTYSEGEEIRFWTKTLLAE